MQMWECVPSMTPYPAQKKKCALCFSLQIMEFDKAFVSVVIGLYRTLKLFLIFIIEQTVNSYVLSYTLLEFFDIAQNGAREGRRGCRPSSGSLASPAPPTSQKMANSSGTKQKYFILFIIIVVKIKLTQSMVYANVFIFYFLSKQPQLIKSNPLQWSVVPIFSRDAHPSIRPQKFSAQFGRCGVSLFFFHSLV